MQNAARKPLQTAKALPALRLVDTKTLDREEWLTVRKTGIGSSDAAAAVGLNPYKSQLELWMEKTGRDELLPKADPRDEESPMYWGSLLEAIVAAHYTKRTGYRVRRINAVLQHPDANKAWMLANIDREILGNPEASILECKTAGINGARLWKDGVPEYVELQVQHQLAVTGKEAADVAVLVGGQELRIHRIERDEGLIARLVELEARFWNYVVMDTAPPADGSDSSAEALQCLYPQDKGSVADFRQDARLSAGYADLLVIRQLISDQQDREAELKQGLQQAMGDASKALFETGEVTWKKAKDSTGIDLKKLMADYPELVGQYAIVKPGSRRFLFL